MQQITGIASHHARQDLEQRRSHASLACIQRGVARGQVATLKKVLEEVRRKIRLTLAWSAAYFSVATTIEIKILAIKAHAQQSNSSTPITLKFAETYPPLTFKENHHDIESIR